MVGRLNYSQKLSHLRIGGRGQFCCVAIFVEQTDLKRHFANIAVLPCVKRADSRRSLDKFTLSMAAKRRYVVFLRGGRGFVVTR